MTRSALSADNRTEATAAHLRRCWMVKIGFPSGTLYLTTADLALPYDGQSYLPDGSLLDVVGITEGAMGGQDPITILLSGADSTMVSALTDDIHFAEVEVFEGFLDEAHELVDDPHDHGLFYMSHLRDEFDDERALITLTCENALHALGERIDRVLCDGSAQRKRAGATDTLFDLVTTLVGLEVNWGGRRQGVSSGGPGAGGSGAGSISLPTQRDDGSWRPA